MRVLGFDDWKNSAEFASNKKRAQHKARSAQRIKEAVAQYTFEDICAKLYEAGIPHAPVNTPLDLLGEEHLEKAGRWLNLEVSGRRFKVPKLPIDLRTTTDFEVRNHPDSLGHHTDEILAGAGYSPAAIEQLKAAGAVLASARILNIERNDA